MSVMLNDAGEAGDGRRQLTTVSCLDGQPRVVIWMCVGVDNNHPPAAAHLRLRQTTRRTIENGRCSEFREKFRGPMPMFSCLPSDADQTSVAWRHRLCWVLADSVSRLVAGYMCEVLQYGICRRYYVTTEWRWRPEWVGVNQTDWRHAWLITAGCWCCRYSRCSNVPWLFLKLPSVGPPTLRRPPTSRNWSWSRMTLRRMTHETTHRHNTSPVTRRRHYVHPAATMVARNRPHPFKCCRRRCGHAAVRSCYSIDVCFMPGL